MRRAAAVALILCPILIGCSAAAAVRPAAYPDADVPCPGGLKTWNLKVLDRRARTESSDKVVATVSDAIEKSFPGCRWVAEEGQPVIEIEIHAFGAEKQGEVWDATASWTVTASSAMGSTLLSFEADETVSRPNYRGFDNEKEALTQAYNAAVERTVKGLRTVRSSQARPREGTRDPWRGQLRPAPANL
jgi:hypothetical protein